MKKIKVTIETDQFASTATASGKIQFLKITYNNEVRYLVTLEDHEWNEINELINGIENSRQEAKNEEKYSK